jgi:GAF domain-containing protein
VDDELRSMRETGRPWRWGPADLPLTGTFVEEARALGIRTAVGVPIVVDGRVWGFAFASSVADKPFADDAAARLANFTELVATAISNAQARAEVQRLADEQAALRRVATLVARESPAEEVFAAVAEEIARLLPVEYAGMGRYEADHTVTRLAVWGRSVESVPPGPLTLGGKNLATIVLDTGRPARIDDYADASGLLGVNARETGTRFGGRDADHRRGPPVGRHGRGLDPGAAAAPRRRGAPRLVHGARRDSDRKRREPR